MITGIDELKKLTKHILCECKCKFDRKKYQCECEKYNAYEKKKNYIWNPATCSC